MLLKILGSLVYSNFFTAAALTCLTASAYALIPDLEFRYYPVLSIFFGSLMLYNFHRIYKVDMIGEAFIANRHRWLLEHSRFTKYIMGFSAFILMLILPSFDTDDIVWLVPAGIVSIGYTVPFIPVKNSWWRFRDIPIMKPMIIASVVTYLTLAFPVFEELGINSVGSRGVMLIMAERFTFILAVTLPFEIRDIKGDEAAGLVTLASKYGTSIVIRLSMILLVVWISLMIWRAFSFGLTIDHVFLPFLALFAPAAGLRLIQKPRNEITYALLFEGALIVYAFVMIWLGM